MHDWHHWLYLLSPFHGVFTLLFGTAAVLVRKLRQGRRESRVATWPTVDAVLQASRLVHGNGYQVQVDPPLLGASEIPVGQLPAASSS